MLTILLVLRHFWIDLLLADLQEGVRVEERALVLLLPWGGLSSEIALGVTRRMDSTRAPPMEALMIWL